jgi:nucleoside-diphosphate-sugar epimerase
MIAAAASLAPMPPAENPSWASNAYAEKTCLVTGGLGFIGSNLTLALLEVGARVLVVDALEPRHGGNPANLEGTAAEIEIGNIADAGVIGGPLREADYVFNLAGQVSHTDSITDPLHDLDLNARDQLSFLELAREIRPTAPIVYASTRQIYGRPRALPVAEDHPIEPVDVNGISKAAAERLHLLYGRIHSMRTSALRLSNVYGPRQRLDCDHLGFLPVFIRKALGREPIAIFGDGSQRRDCLYVDDAVDAFLRAQLTPGASGQAFNIGHDENHSLVEIADLLVELAGGGEVTHEAWPEKLERIAIDSYRGDHTKAKRTLGWRPVTDLRRGLSSTLEHFRVGNPRPG